MPIVHTWRAPSRLGGYTLIEVMTAVVVMTIGATGILAMQGASVRSNQDANETSVAGVLAGVSAAAGGAAASRAERIRPGR